MDVSRLADIGTQCDTRLVGRNEGAPLRGVSANLRNGGFVLGFSTMEINQIKRFIKDLEERTDSLRRYL